MTAPRWQPFYCEENVYHLCAERLAAAPGAPTRVAIVTNAERQCALWEQRAAPPGQALLWDYHVLLFGQDGGAWQAWDLDSRLGMPVPAADYLARTFRIAHGRHAPRFRLVDGRDYLATFCSTRAHMLRQNGSWQAEPPPWPAIAAGPAGVALERWLDLTDQAAGGEVLDLAGLAARLTG